MPPSLYHGIPAITMLALSSHLAQSHLLDLDCEYLKNVEMMVRRAKMNNNSLKHVSIQPNATNQTGFALPVHTPWTDRKDA